MLIKKISVFIIALLIAAMSTVGAFALPSEDSGNRINSEVTSYSSLNNPSEGSLQPSGGADNKTYTIEVFGDKSPFDEIRDYVKCFEFTVNYDGQSKDVIAWVHRTGTESVTLIFTDSEGALLTVDNSPEFIKQSNEKRNISDENNTFEIIKNKDSLIVVNKDSDKIREISLIKADSISNINYLLDSVDTQIPQTSVGITDEITERDDSNGFFGNNTDETEEVNDVKEPDDKGDKKDSKSPVLIIIIVVLVLIIIGVVVFFIYKKRNEDDDSDPTGGQPGGKDPRFANRNKPAYPADDYTRNASPMKAPPTVGGPAPRPSPVFDIPVADNKPFKQTYVSSATNSTNNYQNRNAESSQLKTIINEQKKTSNIQTPPVNSIPLCLINIYGLNISNAERPKFQAVGDSHSADYILVENRYLLLNPLKFSGPNFRTYSDIGGIAYCYEIRKDNYEVSPMGQKIVGFQPATVVADGATFTLSQKGKINVE